MRVPRLRPADATPLVRALLDGDVGAVVEVSEDLNGDRGVIAYLLNQSGSITPSASWSGNEEAVALSARINALG